MYKKHIISFLKILRLNMQNKINTKILFILSKKSVNIQMIYILNKNKEK